MQYGMVSLVAALWAVAGPAAGPKTSYPPLPEAFSNFGAAVSDGFVYVYGGHVGKTHQYSTEAVTGKFRRLNLARPSAGWEELPGDVGLQGLALVAHKGKLYRIGGMQPRNQPGESADNLSTARCAVFDPAAGKWQALPDLPAGRSSHDAVVVGDLLVVVGGWQMNGRGNKAAWHDTTLLLDLARKPLRWESIPQPFERRALNVAACDGKVYVLCGMSSDNALEKTVDVLDLKTRRWSRGPTLPGPIRNGFTPAACTGGGKLYVSPPDGKVYRLTEKRDGWEEVGAVEKPRIVHRIVPAGDDLLLVLGGGSRNGNVAQTEAVEPACCGKPVAPPAVKPGQQVFCPVMTSIPIEADSKEVEYRGVKIKLCCASCARKWNADPEAYLNPTLLPQLRGMDLPRRPIEQVFCPVYPDRVVSARGPSAEYRGTTVYFFSEAAKRTFLAAPEKYADPKLLPQRKTPPPPGASTWPGFRGQGDNVTAARGLPLKWSPTQNIAWKVDLPGYGQSSPVVCGGKVFVTAVAGAEREKGFVLAYDAASGKELWRHEFAPTQKAKWSSMVSRAAPTPVVDSAAVYAFFEGGDLLALSHTGERLWARSLVKEYGEFQNGHGLGSSPAQTENAVIVLIDHRGPSYLLAVEKQTGKTLWKTDRPSRGSWTSPVIARRGGRPEVIVSSNGSVAGYHAGTGKLLWEHDGLSGNTVPSACVAGEWVLVGAGLGRMGGDPKAAARSNCCLKLVEKDGKPGYELCWTARKATSGFATPLVYRGHAYFVSQEGVVSCLDLATGAERFAERIEGPCWSSPLGAGDYVYFFGKEGVTTVLKAGPTFAKVAINTLWDAGPQPGNPASTRTTADEKKPPEQPPGVRNGGDRAPTLFGVAVVDEAFFVRTGTTLYRIGKR